MAAAANVAAAPAVRISTPMVFFFIVSPLDELWSVFGNAVAGPGVPGPGLERDDLADQPVLVREGNQLDPVFEFELGQDVPDVGFHRGVAENQGRGDFPVGQAFGSQHEDIVLPG